MRADAFTEVSALSGKTGGIEIALLAHLLEVQGGARAIRGRCGLNGFALRLIPRYAATLRGFVTGKTGYFCFPALPLTNPP